MVAKGKILELWFSSTIPSTAFLHYLLILRSEEVSERVQELTGAERSQLKWSCLQQLARGKLKFPLHPHDTSYVLDTVHLVSVMQVTTTPEPLALYNFFPGCITAVLFLVPLGFGQMNLECPHPNLFCQPTQVSWNI